MLKFKNIAALKEMEGHTFEPTEWITIDQEMIDKFADATGDHQWIHVDVERAKNETPFKSTIAHGFLTLSLLPKLSYTLYELESAKMGFNYGANKLRFISPVKAGSKVRLVSTLKNVDMSPGSAKVYMDCVVNIDGEEKPALIYEMISMVVE